MLFYKKIQLKRYNRIPAFEEEVFLQIFVFQAFLFACRSANSE